MNHSTPKPKRHDSPNGNGRNGSGTSANGCCRTCSRSLPDPAAQFFIIAGTHQCGKCANGAIARDYREVPGARAWLEGWQARIDGAMLAAGMQRRDPLA